jgi:hypothetical protein
VVITHLTTTEPNEGRKFFAQLTRVILVPMVIVICFFEWMAWRSGDTVPPDIIARWQSDDTHLAWGGPRELFSAVKIAGARIQRPEIIALGASRAGQLRSAMFKPYSFYNCAMAAFTFDQYRQVLEKIVDTYSPRVVIFSLDYYMFSSAFEDHWNKYADVDFTDDHFNRLYSFARTFVVSPKPAYAFNIIFGRTDPIDGNRLLGSSALDGSSSFRHDGSILYSSQFRNDAPVNRQKLSTILSTVAPGSGSRMDPVQIERLRNFVEFARRRGITLIGIQMPILKDAVQVLDSGADFEQTTQFYGADTGVWKEFESAKTRTLFESMGIIFVDLARAMQGDPRYFIDAGHPGEYAVLGSVVEALNNTRVRAALPAVNIELLRQKLQRQNPSNFFDVFHDEF